LFHGENGGGRLGGGVAEEGEEDEEDFMGHLVAKGYNSPLATHPILGFHPENFARHTQREAA